MKHSLKVALVGIGLLAAQTASATIVLDFEGVANHQSVADFYNGGTDGAGNSGTNYGINFSNTSLGLIDYDAGGSGNFGNEPSPDTVLFFLSGGAATMNIAAGFETGFSFFYSSTAFAGSVTVYDGLNGTGNILATLALDALGIGSGDPNGVYSNWAGIGINFAGIAKSVDFAGTANNIAFDNVTLGSATPGGGNQVPEPATLALMGLGLAGLGYKRKQNQGT